MSDNVLEILGIADKEDVISNLLAYCIEQNTAFRNVFLEKICGFDATTYSDCRVFTRLQVPAAGVPDLVVVCRGQTTDWVIIENKLKADEGKDQTVRYADPKTVAALSKQLKLDSAASRPKFVFLTLFPDQVPVSEHFSRACYSSLLRNEALLDQGEALVHRLSSAWLEVLEDFYASTHFDPGDVLAEKLSSTQALDAGYLAFRTLIRTISLPPGLAPDHFSRQSQKGRRYYVAAITMPKWKTERFDDSGRWWTLPVDNRRIHIEPQYDVLARTMKVHIHYETNPYHPVRELREYVVSHQYEAYIARRNAFIRHFAEFDIAPFREWGGSNQLASAEISLSGRIVAEIQQEMKMLIEVAAEIIDQTLNAESTD